MKDLIDQKQFVVSRKKLRFFDPKTGKVSTIHKGKDKEHEFELTNDNIYNLETDELVEIGKQFSYNSQFLIMLRKMYVMEVKDFLSFHYEAENKTAFTDYLKYAMLQSDNLRETTKAVIRDWLNYANENTEQDYNRNYFNKYTSGLFYYLVQKYEANTKVKYIDIWYFLKRDYKPENRTIVFTCTQEKYKNFIKKEFDISIKKFEQSSFKYEDTVKGILTDLADEYSKKYDINSI